MINVIIDVYIVTDGIVVYWGCGIRFFRSELGYGGENKCFLEEKDFIVEVLVCGMV